MDNKTTLILPVFYLPPIQYFVNLIHFRKVLFETNEHYIKQTYRNRCKILCANGTLSLSVPVQHTNKEHTAIKDIKISYTENWQKIHWKSIESAYRTSPFFEFYEDKIAGFYHKKYDFLIEFNMALIELMLSLIKINLKYSYTISYEKKYNNFFYDYRGVMHPKRNKDLHDENFILQPYTQVFSSKHKFIPNLSIIDLLFNEGEETMNVLTGITQKNC